MRPKRGHYYPLNTIRLTLARGLRFLQSLGLITVDDIDPTKASDEISPAIQKDWFSNRWKPHSYRTLDGVTGALVNELRWRQDSISPARLTEHCG